MSVDYTKNSELKKLQFLAPGPKMTTVCESDNVKEDAEAPGNTMMLCYVSLIAQVLCFGRLISNNSQQVQLCLHTQGMCQVMLTC